MTSLPDINLIKFWKKISPALKTHLWVLFTLIISLFFSLLPVMVGAAVEATKSNTELIAVFKGVLLEEAMFIYFQHDPSLVSVASS